MNKPAIVIVPGYNEPDADMLTLADGRRGRPGLKARGFDCRTFPPFSDELDDRIEKYAGFLDNLKLEGVPFPIVSLGYSVGGLVVRGFLRKYPERAHEICHTITLGTPHWGLTVDILPLITAFLRYSDQSIAELDLRSDFMAWLNQSRGHWVGHLFHRSWVLDREPWVAPPGSCLFSIYGIVPHFGGNNDGIVWEDSCTLGGRIRSTELRDERANHLNLIGAWNLGTTLLKGFTFNDEIWPRAIAMIADHIDAHLTAEAIESAAAQEALAAS